MCDGKIDIQISALKFFKDQPNTFDLVITDMTMPKMTGDEFATEIFAIRPDIPIIVCSGYSEKMDGNKAKEIGAAGYLEKPYDQRELAQMIRKVLDQEE